MSAFREYFLSRGMLRTEKFDFSKLDTRARSYAGRAFRGIIFCEGWRAVENPYFSWLPYRPAKGEILELKSPEPLPEHIIHRGNWIMKTGGETFRMGSTWEREKLDCLPTEGAGAELLGGAAEYIRARGFRRSRGPRRGSPPVHRHHAPAFGRAPRMRRADVVQRIRLKGFCALPVFCPPFRRLDFRQNRPRPRGRFVAPHKEILAAAGCGRRVKIFDLGKFGKYQPRRTVLRRIFAARFAPAERRGIFAGNSWETFAGT